MEKRFEIAYKANPKRFVEFNKIILAKTKMSLIYIIIGAIFSFVLYPLIELTSTDMESNSVFIVPGMVFLILGLWFDKLGSSKKAVIKNQSKVAKQAGTITFTDETQNFSSEFESSSLKYSAFEALVETENTFFLFVGRNQAVTVGKDEFSFGTPDEFRAFIQEKTGKTFKFISLKSNNKRAVIGTIISVVLFLATVFGVSAAKNAMLNAEKVFSITNYSITLNESYQEVLDTNVDLCIENEKTSVFITFFSNETLNEYYDISFEDTALFTTWVYNETEKDVIGQRNISADQTHIEFTINSEGFGYYYYCAVQKVEGGFWVTEFGTPAGLKDDYRDDYIKFIETIDAK